jgi:hypothetical protein
MNRRTFLLGLALGSVSGRFAVEAQQANVAKIGLLAPTNSVVAASPFVLEVRYSAGQH